MDGKGGDRDQLQAGLGEMSLEGQPDEVAVRECGDSQNPRKVEPEGFVGTVGVGLGRGWLGGSRVEAMALVG